MSSMVPLTGQVGGLFESEDAFELGQRMANVFAESSIVPQQYRKNLPNCMIALDMAMRLKTSPMMVMQNLYIVNGSPAWSSQYIVATINASRKYKTELQYDMQGQGDTLSCYAWAMDHNDHKVQGPTITMKMAKDAGWYNKNGSKWKTMPEVMIRYRAASFFGRLNCPDMIMGIYSTDEVLEMPDMQYVIADDEKSVEAEIAAQANQIPIDMPDEESAPTSNEKMQIDNEDARIDNEDARIDAETGEIIDEPNEPPKAETGSKGQHALPF